MGQQTPGGAGSDSGGGMSPQVMQALQGLQLQAPSGGGMGGGMQMQGLASALGGQGGAQGIGDPSAIAAARARFQPGMGAGMGASDGAGMTGRVMPGAGAPPQRF